MHFAIGGQSGGVIGFVILAGAIGIVAVIVFTMIVQRATGSDDGPPEVGRVDDDDAMGR